MTNGLQKYDSLQPTTSERGFMHTLEGHLKGGEWVCGERFTMADV